MILKWKNISYSTVLTRHGEDDDDDANDTYSTVLTRPTEDDAVNDAYSTVLTRHGEDAHEDADAPPRQHDLLGVVRPLGLLLGRPDAHAEDHQVEQNDADNARDVDHRGGLERRSS